MNVLPPRFYNPRTDKADRRRFLPNGVFHPAKMTVALALDLFRRYTLPGQRVLDPCLGVGTSLVGMLLGRHVTGIELEVHHHRDAQANGERIARMAASLGHPDVSFGVWQGDSRQVIGELFGPHDPDAEAVVTSGAFGEMNGEHRGGDIQQRPAKDGKGFEGGKEFFVYGGIVTSPAYGNQEVAPMDSTSIGDHLKRGGGANSAMQGKGYEVDAIAVSPAYGPQLPDGGDPAVAQTRITQKVADGKLTHPEGTKVGKRTAWGGGTQRVYATGYGVDAIATSPAYESVASRDRHTEPFAQKDPERARKYGQDSPSRNVSGYGKNPAQIGNMKLKDSSYQTAMTEVYARCLEATRPGGVLVTVTGNYLEGGHFIPDPAAPGGKRYEGGTMVDLAEVTIELCVRAGWTPVERWRAVKRSGKGTPQVSFWRTTQAKQGMPLIDWEDVLVFARGEPGWGFKSLDNGRWP